MAYSPDKLTNIRVKTARMLELHALLEQELDGADTLSIPPAEREKLERAIARVLAA